MVLFLLIRPSASSILQFTYMSILAKATTKIIQFHEFFPQKIFIKNKIEYFSRSNWSNIRRTCRIHFRSIHLTVLKRNSIPLEIPGWNYLQRELISSSVLLYNFSNQPVLMKKTNIKLIWNHDRKIVKMTPFLKLKWGSLVQNEKNYKTLQWDLTYESLK